MPGVRVADPKACQCGEVLKGVIKPYECKVLRHRVHSRARDRDLHGLAGGSLRGLLHTTRRFAREKEARLMPDSAVSERERKVLDIIETARAKRPRFRGRDR